MELKKIDHRSPDKGEIKKIFLEAFPPEERPPYFILLRKAGHTAGVDFNGVYDEGKLVGMTYVIREKELAYLLFLAIKKEERGHGYGGKLMEMLKEKYKGCRLFLALETLEEDAENYAQRLSRHRFYQRYGFRDMPYRIKEASVIYDMMGLGGEVTPTEFKKLMDRYLGWFVKLFFDTRLIEKSKTALREKDAT